MGRDSPFLAAAVASALALAACSRDPAPRSGQVAARVNGGEISIQHAATRQSLEQAIDQELMMQRAIARGIDRDPVVKEMLDSSRRRILAQAYIDSAMQEPASATPEEIRAFYASHPALFAQRRVYIVRESLPAEDVPLELLPRIARLKPGQSASLPSPSGGTKVVELLEATDAPLSEPEAAPAIGQFLTGRKRGELAREEARKLREQAEIEYLGPIKDPQERKSEKT